MDAVGDAWAQAEVADKAKRVQADLGWVIHPDFSGRGLATEAVREVLRICFESSNPATPSLDTELEPA